MIMTQQLQFLDNPKGNGMGSQFRMSSQTPQLLDQPSKNSLYNRGLTQFFRQRVPEGKSLSNAPSLAKNVRNRNTNILAGKSIDQLQDKHRKYLHIDDEFD
uniref:Uncharacterized protein n=1 Tax=Strombidium rassoulzadegani TaxID=1082188 RepID=A0A7S3CP49_9SPIT|mmetsp:Transcript_18976/g.32422  ORF Transcript_18976/g.32422 Transcript_18976/m.32422 type:complete len:101 (+) Transcript_18976:1079-1381(+)